MIGYLESFWAFSATALVVLQLIRWFAGSASVWRQNSVSMRRQS